MRFSLGVNYWPRRASVAMWRVFDAGEIDEDFARIAELGLDTVRFFLRWDDFAPQPGALEPLMLDRLETFVSLAEQHRLRTVPTLFCGHVGGVNFLPAWSLDSRTPGGPFRTICGETPSPFVIGDMYRGPLLDAQIAFATTVGVRLRAHPAVHAWDIGDHFTSVRQPRGGKARTGEHSPAPLSEYEVAEWSRRLADALGPSEIPVTAGTESGDLTSDRNVRLGTLCAPFAFASMQGTTVTSGFARSRLDAEVVPFLAMVAAAFSQKPVTVTSFGAPQCPPEKFSAFERFALPGEPPNMTISEDDSAFATYPCLTEYEAAAYATRVLERLHQDGRLGAYWGSWADAADEWATRPPFDRAAHERTGGLIRADGTERPVAAAFRSFAAEARAVNRADDMPMISSDYYYRTLPTSAKTLYDGYLGFIEERRT